jgi:hypothetical protein
MIKHIINQDKLMEYSPRSNPERSIYIPFKYYYRAENLINLVLESENMKQFHEKVSLCPSLKDVYIPEKVEELVGDFDNYFNLTKKVGNLSKYFDQAYLETCYHMMQDDLSRNNVLYGEFGKLESGLERLQKIKNIENIKKTLESLK